MEQHLCIFCEQVMKADSIGFYCKNCDVHKDYALYIFEKIYKGHTFKFEYDLLDQCLTVWDLDSHAEDKRVYKTGDLFLITPKNCLKKLPMLIVFS